MDLCYCNLVKVERRYLDEAALFHIFTQAKQKNRGERERERERTIIHVFISIIHSKQLILWADPSPSQ